MGSITYITIVEGQQGLRLDQALVCSYQGLSRTKVQQMIDLGKVTVNGIIEKKRYVVALGDTIAFEPQVEEPLHVEAESMDFEIVYEDKWLFVVNKPPGLVVHPAPGNRSGTFANGLVAHCGEISSDDPVRPGIVHRLDKETSGVLIAAKNQAIVQALSGQFHDREVEKEYFAIVVGEMKQEQVVSASIGRHPKQRKKMAVVEGGKEAKTRFLPLKVANGYTFVKAIPYTGRTHQIRVHVAELGFPILGDALYGQRRGVGRQMLHCSKIGCVHPMKQEKMLFTASLWGDMQKVCAELGLA